MRPTVYIETTIPSYYCDDRSELANDIARTRAWWDEEQAESECFISPVVIDELRSGSYDRKDACLALVTSVPLLGVSSEVIEIAKIYQEHKLMPTRPEADALHVAFASYYRMDYLLTGIVAISLTPGKQDIWKPSTPGLAWGCRAW